MTGDRIKQDMSNPEENDNLDPYAPNDNDFADLEKALESRFAAFGPASGQGPGVTEPPVIVGNKGVLMAVMAGQKALLETMLKKGSRGNSRFEDGWTALMIAAFDGHTGIAELLMDKGAELEAKGGNGWTALMVAAFNRHPDTAETLIARGADVNARDNDGKTVLMWAADKGFEHLAGVLLGKGANPNAKSNKEATALSYAVRGDHAAVIDLLKKSGAKE